MVVSPGVPSYPAESVPFGVFLLSACSPTAPELELEAALSCRSRRWMGCGCCNRVLGIDWWECLDGSFRGSADGKAELKA